jgi:hypothetical protein
METYNVEIEGMTRYYFNKPWKGAVPKSKKQKEVAAKASVYLNEDGHCHIPWQQIKGCIKQATSLAKMKIERSNRRAIELIQAALWVMPEALVLLPERSLDGTELFWHDLLTEQGKLIEVCYSRTNSWSLKFQLQFSLVEPDFIQEALRFGGWYCGIGGRRQDKNGRFELVTWEPSTEK